MDHQITSSSTPSCRHVVLKLRLGISILLPPAFIDSPYFTFSQVIVISAPSLNPLENLPDGFQWVLQLCCTMGCATPIKALFGLKTARSQQTLKNRSVKFLTCHLCLKWPVEKCYLQRGYNRKKILSWLTVKVSTQWVRLLSLWCLKVKFWPQT